ncbi:GFA family protein [Nioella aestuarii]|uniref:GFA family protein n=1 Tax=Nioella aestuarii TaxID=1662864 RepID=UPI003D7FF0F8
MAAGRTHHEGGCYCGAIRYRISGEPTFSAHCHCRSCQRALGGAFVTWAVVALKNFEVVRGVIKTCEKTKGIHRGFCGDCGTTLTYAAKNEVEGEDWSKDAWFTAASLDDPAIVTPKNHVYVSHKQPWITLNDGLPCFEKF